MTLIQTLRQLYTFTDDEECTNVSVKGDATYCIKGPVCGATDKSSKHVQGACPSEGDAAIGHCLKTSRSYANGCVAPVDAQCVISALDQWECVFPDITNAPTRGLAPATSPPASEVSSLSSTMALSATDTNTDSESDIVKAPNTTLNVIVAASCCVLALVGIVVVKKRRNRRNKERESEYRLSRSDITIVTL